MALNNADTTEYIETVLNNSAIKVFRSNSSTKPPNKSYVTYAYTGNPVLGSAPITSHVESATALTEYVTVSRTSNLEVQFYTQTESQARKSGTTGYEQANDLAQKFEDSLKSDRVKRYMRTKGFSVLSTSSIINLDKMLGDRWERRAIVELVLNNITEVSNSVEFYSPPVTVTITAEDI